MADKKITELDPITTIDAADVSAIVDISADTTYKMTVAQLSAAIKSGIPMTLGGTVAVDDLVKLLSDGTVRRIGYAGATGFYGTTTHALDTNETLSVAAACKLTENKFVLAFSSQGDTCNRGYVGVGTVGATGVTWGAFANNPAEGALIIVRLARLTDTSFIEFYTDGSSSEYRVRVGTVAIDDTITFGTYVTMEWTGWVGYESVDALSPTSFVLTWRASDVHAQARIGTLSGTTITLGTTSEFQTVVSYSTTAVTALTSSLFVVVYNGASEYGKVRAGSVSGTTITWGTEVQVEANAWDAADFRAIVRISDTMAVVTFVRQSGLRASVAVSASGTTLICGAVSSTISGSGGRSRVVKLQNEASAFAMQYTNGSGYLCMRRGTISTTTISLDAEVVVLSMGGYGNLDMLNIAGSILWVGVNGDSYYYDVYRVVEQDVFGIAQESGVSSDVKRVATLGDIAAGFTGLTPNKMYYYNLSLANGLASAGDFYAGRAISTTQLQIRNVE